jgi:exopolysaccharide biosynthesis protein
MLPTRSERPGSPPRAAINLDGGGSTTMVVGGRVVNQPSDTAGERPVGDALLLLPHR